MVETYDKIKKLTKGTPIKVKRVKGTDNVCISGAGYKRRYVQIGTNTGISASTMIKARKRILKKR